MESLKGKEQSSPLVHRDGVTSLIYGVIYGLIYDLIYDGLLLLIG